MLSTKTKSAAVLTVSGLLTALLILTVKPATSTPLIQGQATAAATADQGTAGYKLASTDDLDLPMTGALYLAPDGQRIAQTDGKSICLYNATGEKQVCSPVSSGVDDDSLRWSPDSHYIVFTENFFRFFHNPDIHLIDMDGKLTDLTDDHGAKLSFSNVGKDPNVNLDVAPTWFPDGKRILFVRSALTDGIMVANLYSIDLAGADLKQEGSLNADKFSTTVLAVSPDGKKVAYNFASGNRKDTNNGLWVCDMDGRNAKQFIRATLGDLDPKTYQPGVPLDLAYSADGRFIQIFDPALLAMSGIDASTKTSRVAAADGSSTSPVDADDNARFATWAPRDAALAYAVRDAKNADNTGLYVAAKPGAPGQLIYKGNVLPPGGNWRTLIWASNNTILIKHSDGGKTPVALLHLVAQ